MAPAATTPDRRENFAAEAAVVGLIVLIAAIGMRAIWIPDDWQTHLANAADLIGIPVADVGKWFSAWSIGDGQVFAAIANDPLGIGLRDFLLEPIYRYLRAGFSWFTWTLTFYNPGWIPYGMALVGATSIAGLFLLSVRLRPTLGRAAWFLALNPAIFIAFAGDTAEGLGALLLALALATGSRVAVVTLGFTRPSYLIALAVQWRLVLWGLGSAAAIAVFALVQFGFASSLSLPRIAPPFFGYLAEPSSGSLALAAVASVTAAVGWKYRNLSWVVSGIFVLCFGALVVEFPPDAWRSAGFLPILWAFGPSYDGPSSLSDVEAQWRAGPTRRDFTMPFRS